MKTVKIQVKCAAAHPGQDRRLRCVVTHILGLCELLLDRGCEIVLEDSSRVAIDWVAGQSYSSVLKARRLLNVQSGPRKDKVKMLRPLGSNAGVRDRGH